MKQIKRTGALLLVLALALGGLYGGASAKTIAAGQTVGTVLFYAVNDKGEDVLVSHITVSEMDADLQAGKINEANHNYALLDRYVTTVHQEAQGFTVPEFVQYAQSKSSLAQLRTIPLTFAGKDEMAFWEIDQTGYDDMDTYTYQDLYGVSRYNFPLLYEYWNYRTQDYGDPQGKMTRDEVVNYIFKHGEPEVFLLSVRAFSQRYIATDEKYGTGDFNMENLWQTMGRLDAERTIRMMMPMTEADLRSKTPTASNTRYWVANIRLRMERPPAISSAGTVVAPSAVMTEDADHYYITFQCATAGATILYNHNFNSPSYAPTCEYKAGTEVVVPKKAFPNGVVTMTCRGVKDGYTDKGVVTLELRPSGTHTTPSSNYTDVPADAWYADAVAYVSEAGLFKGTGGGRFTPDGTMTRSMFTTVLHRYAGTPAPNTSATFSDVPAGQWYTDGVRWAAGKNIVNGTGGGRFTPDGVITLEQMATILYRYTGGKATGAVPTAYGPVSSWAVDGMRWAEANGLLANIGGTLTAQGAATRAQVAGMMKNLKTFLDS